MKLKILCLIFLILKKKNFAQFGRFLRKILYPMQLLIKRKTLGVM